MVIFKLFTDIVEIWCERVIYDGSGSFKDFPRFLRPELRVTTVCKKLFAFSA